jgi:hypothetical protein
MQRWQSTAAVLPSLSGSRSQVEKRKFMKQRICRSGVLSLIAVCALLMLAPHLRAEGPYKVIKKAKVGGDGGFDYIFADAAGRRLYVPRSGEQGHLMVFNLDTLAPAGEIAGLAAGGATVDPKSHHGFSTSRPAISMWDTATLKVIKTIPIGGRADGIKLDTFNDRVWVFSHEPPYATVIDAKEGTVVGTLDLGGSPEEAVSDGKGTIYVNISDKANIAVVDAKTLTVIKHYDVSSKGVSGGSGLALDEKNHILFAYYREPLPTVVIVNALTGKILTALSTGTGVDTVAFIPETMEAVSAEAGGTMTFIKETSPTSFSVVQTLPTMVGAKTLALDSKTGRLFTMSAEYEPAPAGAPMRTRGRPPIGPMIPGSFSVLMVGK